MSPGKRILYVAGSPARFIKTQIRPGSTKSSIFALVIVCLGAGTLTIPYVIYENGFVLGPALILFGGLISSFTGYMIIFCVDQTNATCFEDIALSCYSKRWARFTSMCMIACNVGFTISYFVLFKSFMPYAIEQAINGPLPTWCNSEKTG
jgi:amino acid permease